MAKTITRLFCILALGALAFTLAAQPKKIPVEDYRAKVYASWIGQCIGNIYGLPHENQYIDSPGALKFPYGYADLKRIGDANGAFSDDDTDLEYMYLLAMEEHGPEPTYRQLTQRWLHHIHNRLWLANRGALGLMYHGFTPPYTGMKAYNPHWFQIDPQLVNEIWAVTAPGMVNYAAAKSDWAARITDDSWGVEPTIHYGAMYAAAFFESDIAKLIDIGTASLPRGSRFAAVVEDMKQLYRKYPHDMAAARREMAEKYYVAEPAETRTIWNATLNGAASILALLYGDGDFQKTLDIACYMGFDADNQAASMSGLIAIVRGMDGIPKELLYPFPDRNWKEPLNDVYKNVSRYDMPDASLKDMARRIADQGEKLILRNGGKKVVEGGKEYYIVNPGAVFSPPLEVAAGPLPVMEAGKPVRHELMAMGCGSGCRWTLRGGSLPAGLSFQDGVIAGTPKSAGIAKLSVQVAAKAGQASMPLTLVVRPGNLASSAERVLASTREVTRARIEKAGSTVGRSIYAESVEVIRDGRRYGEGSAFSTFGERTGPKQDYFGYEWKSPQTIGMLAFTVGVMEERAGWFQNLRVEYRDSRGNWEQVLGTIMSPQVPGGQAPYDKPHFAEYLIAFQPVTSTAIRLVGDAPTPSSAERDTFTSISELCAYGELPGYREGLR